MKSIGRKSLEYLKSYPYGQVATAFFLLCAASGVVLALPYDVHNAWASVSKLMVFNPWAAFFRNFHYWTAQLFLIFTLIHILDYGLRRGFGIVKHGIWMHLVFALVFLFYVMISGFILKDDPDSRQALQILASIFSSVPFAGDWLKEFFLGRPEDLQVIYIHHVATATIILFIIIVEHSGLLWTAVKPALYAFLISILLSLFLAAPLHDGFSAVTKGPWYFLGVQEILHYFSSPLPVVFGFIFILFLIYLLRFMGHRAYSLSGYFLLMLAFVYFLFTLFALFFRGADWEWIPPWKYSTNRHIILNPQVPLWYSTADSLNSPDSAFVLGRYEGCLSCHGGMKGFSPSHDFNSIGCASCHLGNPFTLNKEAAHRGMILVPGNLSTAHLACGSANCHADITRRIHTSMMTTLSGMVSVDRYVFGELAQPHGFFHIQDLQDSPADMHMRNLCSGCHLGQPKNLPGVPHYLEKGGGCNACHLHYDSLSAAMVENYYHKSAKGLLPALHPRLTIDISNDKCASCHNRSGRITESYAGWYETLLSVKELKPGQEFRVIEGKRVFLKTTADVHHEAGLACIDCHDAWETMGDGNFHPHKEDAVKISCSDCHRENLEAPLKVTDLDAEARKITALRDFLQKGSSYAASQKARRPIFNVQKLPGGEIKLVSRLDGKWHDLKAPAEVCKADVHASLSCQSCHSAWAPTCLGCHNEWKPALQGWDFKTQKPTKGAWQESAGIFEARQPSLGVRELGGVRETLPFVPGMVLTVDPQQISKNKHEVFHRLFAPIDPHTTVRSGLHCKACHNNSIALGYGAGHLEYEIISGKARWKFDTEYAPMPQDGIPPDAWTGFMKTSFTSSSTRLHHRPFTPDEQKKILQVGACLHCHGEKPKFTYRLLFSYEAMLKARSSRCILPE